MAGTVSGREPRAESFAGMLLQLATLADLTVAKPGRAAACRHQFCDPHALPLPQNRVEPNRPFCAALISSSVQMETLQDAQRS